MPDVKPEWLAALRALDDKADLKFNYVVNRWQFDLSHADGVLRSQFWGDFSKPRDPVTGLHPYRELTDDTMREAITNLERTFVGNPYDGHGTVQRQAGRAYFANKRLQEARWQKRGEDFANYLWDHRRQIRDAGTGPLVTVLEEVR
jgi:hypothetical protein